MKPALPTNCREHANGRVVSGERHYEDGEVKWETATFLCGCYASVSCIGEPAGWQLTETIFWKEGQA